MHDYLQIITNSKTKKYLHKKICFEINVLVWLKGSKVQLPFRPPPVAALALVCTGGFLKATQEMYHV